MARGGLSLFQTLPLVVWRLIVRHIRTDYDDSADYIMDWAVTQQRMLVELARVCARLRDVLIELIYAECVFILDAGGQPLNGLAYNRGLVALFAETLYIRVVASGPVSPGTILAGLLRLLPTMPWLQSIVVEAMAPVARAGYDLGGVVRMPRLADIHVVGRPGSRRLLDAAALDIARGLVKMSGVQLAALTLSNMPASPTVVAPLWAGVPQGGVTVLRFSDMEVIEGGAELVRAVRATLKRLTFMRCGLGQLETLLYSANNEPLCYPHLEVICGALSRGEDWFHVPGGAFPRLEYLYEAVGCAWQQRAGVESHLLFNTLAEIVLPRLRVVRLRTSRRMALNHGNLPSLEHVTYYARAEVPERLDAEHVCGQLAGLLRHANLRFLRFYDQVPAVCLLSPVDVRCHGLRYLDLGLITVSYDNVERILGALPHLSWVFLAINDRWSAIQPMRDPGAPLSDSVQVLGIYVANSDPLLRYDCGALTPSRMVVARLPRLRKLCVQDDVAGVKGFLDLMGNEQRFPWSRAVADQVNVNAIDLFGRSC
ncbi:hypothetical protein H4S07_000602 [Coemansia furcata]|uniref:Uncharacterized protein n=1 Tax=Coemansia furcata TaxID=417177 RepID=A0ACC1LRM4_9FUNG|nr:hypothetical protein H4S07_000602 [Coemansia furcata]